MKKHHFVLFVLLNLLVSCGLNTNPPSYVKDIVVYKEGYQGDFKSYEVYFVLADDNGQMTTSNGSVTIEFAEERKEAWFDNPEKYKGTPYEAYAKQAKQDEKKFETMSSTSIDVGSTLHSQEERSLNNHQFRVTIEDFQNTEVGQGAFKHKAIIFPLGRITLYKRPLNSIGKVYLLFRTEDGKEIKGETDIIF